MSTATLERPDVAADDVDDDDLDHIFCCDPEESLCGLRFDDYGTDMCEDCEHPVCELCERVRDEPCGDPKCPDRARWWQVWK